MPILTLVREGYIIECKIDVQHSKKGKVLHYVDFSEQGMVEALEERKKEESPGDAA